MYDFLAMEMYIMYDLGVKLREYIKMFPDNEREGVRKWIAGCCGVGMDMVKSWEYGRRGIRSAYWEDLTAATSGQVTLSDHYPGTKYRASSLGFPIIRNK